jgi:hypothetical protein
VRIDHTVAHLELDVRERLVRGLVCQRIDFEVLQVLFD